MPTNEGKYNGKIALVTGASRGIGTEIAKKLAAGGAKFIGVHYASNREAALRVVADIEKMGSKAVALEADLTTGISGIRKLWSAFEDAVRLEFGNVHLDILINNVGIGPPDSFEETSIEMYEDVMNVNLKTPFFITYGLNANDVLK